MSNLELQIEKLVEASKIAPDRLDIKIKLSLLYSKQIKEYERNRPADDASAENSSG